MKLGDLAQITIGTPDLQASRAFYSGLGFKLLDEGDQPWPWTQTTDGQNLVLLNQDGNEYIGLIYFSTRAEEILDHALAGGAQLVSRQERDGALFQAIFSGPDGLTVGLVNSDPQGMGRPPGKPITRCGKFGEFSQRVANYRTAAAFWTQLGFEAMHESTDPYPWGIFSDGMLVLGLHQTPDYALDDPMYLPNDRPTKTYFAADMHTRIAALKKDGYEFMPEMADENGVVANAVLVSPGYERIFLFQGEI